MMRLTSLCIALILVACSVERPSPASADAPGYPLMWKVSDSDSTLYLLGAVHTLPPDLAWRRTQLDRAMSQAQGLWMESNTYGGAEYDAGEAMKTTNVPLRERLDPETFTRVRAVADFYGVDMANVSRAPIWVLAMELGLPLPDGSTTRDNSAETYSRETARSRGLPVRDLETYPRQLRGYADIPRPHQLTLLDSKLDAQERHMTGEPVAANALAEYRDSARAWARGDTTPMELEQARNREQTPWLYESATRARNIEWAETLSAHMDSTALVEVVVVGNNHTVGPDSLQTLLAKKGYDVRVLTAQE